ncbi:MAG: hypothetical protein B7Y39_14680 [Bdellovibrio sp. 28-41-41]|nr:MAG: hypothetical protein B7Y39_14680 [Bdellovibrio sp. 28-41-41]
MNSGKEFTFYAGLANSVVPFVKRPFGGEKTDFSPKNSYEIWLCEDLAAYFSGNQRKTTILW